MFPIKRICFVALSFVSLATIGIAQGAEGKDSKQVVLPGGQPPQFFMVTAVNKEGLVLARRYPPTKEVDAPEVIEHKPSFKALKVRDAKGTPLAQDEFQKRVRPGQVVLVSEDDDPVDRAYLAVIKPDTVILSGVLPPKGATGAKVEIH